MAVLAAVVPFHPERRDARLQSRITYEWNHGIGEVVTALIQAGLVIEFLHEHRDCYSQQLPWMVPTGVLNEWRLPNDVADVVPLVYSIRAHKP